MLRAPIGALGRTSLERGPAAAAATAATRSADGARLQGVTCGQVKPPAQSLSLVATFKSDTLTGYALGHILATTPTELTVERMIRKPMVGHSLPFGTSGPHADRDWSSRRADPNRLCSELGLRGAGGSQPGMPTAAHMA